MRAEKKVQFRWGGNGTVPLLWVTVLFPLRRKILPSQFSYRLQAAGEPAQAVEMRRGAELPE